MAERRQLNVLVTNESYEGWLGFCRHYGITLTSMIEAVGAMFGRLDEMPTNELTLRVVELAREIDQTRRERRGPTSDE